MILDDLGLPGLPEPLPRPVIDSHTHLDATEVYSRLPPADAVALAASVGVAAAVQVGCDAGDSAWAVAAADRWPGVVATVALHPSEAARRADRLDEQLAIIDRLARDGGPRVRGVGETGLDYYWAKDPEGRRAQQESFRAHIAIAKERGLALVIHDRDAHDDVARVLDESGWPDRVVFHTFSGDAAFARRVLDRGAYLSFSGTVTFKPNQHLRDALRLAPLERVLVETDAPYLTPVPLRGRPNASYLIPHTARFLAAERGDDLGELCDALWRNAEAAFGGPWCDRPGGGA